MSALERKLQRWQEAGLIDEAIAKGILAYERDHGGGWQGRLLLLLGSGTMGIGIISLVAANWARLPDGLKLGGDFALLSLLAVVIHATARRSSWLHEGAIFGFQLLCLASIGLIAQIYHLSGKPWQALGLWVAICLPITLFAHNRASWALWSGGLLAAFGLWVHHWLDLSGGRSFSDWGELGLRAWLATTLLAGGLHHLAASLGWQRFRGLFGYWWLSLGLLLVAALDLLYTAGFRGSLALGPPLFWAAMTGLILGALWLRRDLHLASRLLLTLMVLLAVAATLGNPVPPAVGKLGGALLSLLFLALGLAVAGLERRPALFRLLVVLAGLRIYGLYLQAFGGLAATGVGLILSGGVLILLVLLIKRIQALAKGFRRRPS